MQDGKALQSGTSHLLGSHFTEAFNVKFLDADGREKFARSTSWGVSTRIIGGIIMTHSDDKGLVLPPKIAPIKVVVIPVYTNDAEKQIIWPSVEKVLARLRDQNIELKCDDRDLRPGPKFFEWEKKGVPIRIEIGPRDVADNSVVTVRRDTGEKQALKLGELETVVTTMLDDIQSNLYNRAKDLRDSNTKSVKSYDELKKQVESGFAEAYWCGNADCEMKIKDETKATIRCIPFDRPEIPGKCVFCGKESSKTVLFARAY